MAKRRAPKNTPVSVGGVPLTAEQAAALAANSPDLAAALQQAAGALSNAAGAAAGAAAAAGGQGIGGLFGGMTQAGKAVSGRPGKGLFPAGYSSAGEVKVPLFPEGFASSGGVQETLPAGVDVVDWKAAGKAVAGPGRTARAASGATEAGGAAAAGEVIGGLAGAVNPVAAAFQVVVQAAAMVAGKLNDLSKSAIETDESFRKVSPVMAQIFAERDVRRTFRDVEKGNALAESASALVEAEQRKEDNTKDIEILLGSIQNEVATSWEGFKAELFKPLNAMARTLNDLLNFGRSAGDRVPLGEWFREVVNDAKEGTRRGRPVERGRSTRHPRDEGPGGGGAGGDF